MNISVNLKSHTLKKTAWSNKLPTAQNKAAKLQLIIAPRTGNKSVVSHLPTANAINTFAPNIYNNTTSPELRDNVIAAKNKDKITI